MRKALTVDRTIAVASRILDTLEGRGTDFLTLDEAHEIAGGGQDGADLLSMTIRAGFCGFAPMIDGNGVMLCVTPSGRGRLAHIAHTMPGPKDPLSL